MDLLLINRLRINHQDNHNGHQVNHNHLLSMDLLLINRLRINHQDNHNSHQVNHNGHQVNHNHPLSMDLLLINRLRINHQDNNNGHQVNHNHPLSMDLLLINRLRINHQDNNNGHQVNHNGHQVNHNHPLSMDLLLINRLRINHQDNHNGHQVNRNGHQYATPGSQQPSFNEQQAQPFQPFSQYGARPIPSQQQPQFPPAQRPQAPFQSQPTGQAPFQPQPTGQQQFTPRPSQAPFQPQSPFQPQPTGQQQFTSRPPLFGFPKPQYTGETGAPFQYQNQPQSNPPQFGRPQVVSPQRRPTYNGAVVTPAPSHPFQAHRQSLAPGQSTPRPPYPQPTSANDEWDFNRNVNEPYNVQQAFQRTKPTSRPFHQHPPQDISLTSTYGVPTTPRTPSRHIQPSIQFKSQPQDQSPAPDYSSSTQADPQSPSPSYPSPTADSSQGTLQVEPHYNPGAPKQYRVPAGLKFPIRSRTPDQTGQQATYHRSPAPWSQRTAPSHPDTQNALVQKRVLPNGGFSYSYTVRDDPSRTSPLLTPSAQRTMQHMSPLNRLKHMQEETQRMRHRYLPNSSVRSRNHFRQSSPDLHDRDPVISRSPRPAGLFAPAQGYPANTSPIGALARGQPSSQVPRSNSPTGTFIGPQPPQSPYYKLNKRILKHRRAFLSYAARTFLILANQHKA
ncbi:unnamed protein product [Cyprideis torosa]|uniref:Uncharacterized protein n=1 Tax=Cyprideis torosa TaxID=163714 RepID=A0A7R8ZJD2_9CRUS|nr:unnamed protein product [Cyprideis torosa]CAG0886683.1 unnamed protein product [Cyprideis torosa]